MNPVCDKETCYLLWERPLWFTFLNETKIFMFKTGYFLLKLLIAFINDVAI